MTAANALNISTTGVPYFTGTAFTAPTLTQHGVIIAGASNAIASLGVATNGQLVIGSTGSDPVLANILSGDGTINITNTAGGIDISVAPTASGFSWGSISSAPTTATNRGYMATSALTVTLPSAPADGYIVGLINASSGSVLFQAAGSDLIEVGSATGAAAGTATSATKGDCLVLVYQDSNTTWFSAQVVGIWAVV